MKTIVTSILNRSRLTVGLALALSVVGFISWFQMPRAEDPKLRPRFGLVVAPYPGAGPEEVERSVVEPLEDEFTEIDEIDVVKVSIRSGVAVFNIRLHDEVDAPEEIWDDIDAAIDVAYTKMPASAFRPTINDRLNETEAIVVAISGSNDVLVLADVADELKSELIGHRDVTRVAVSGDPGEQITIEVDETASKRLGVSTAEIAATLQLRNLSAPAGAIRLGSQRIQLRPNGEFESVDAIKRTPIIVRSGAAVPLSTFANVRRSPTEPRQQLARFNGETAVFVGVVPRDGIDVVKFGSEIQTVIEKFRTKNPTVTVSEVAFQPDYVKARLSGLGSSLALGILIVALVLLLAMGVRLGLVVASVVPLVTFASIAVYAASGGIFHQMAAAALVLALGLLVDNAIVMTELIQSKLDAGASKTDAVYDAVVELAVPLLSSTGTTLAAFVPMLLAEGPTGEFTAAIPTVAMMTLSVSYIYAMCVTPLLAAVFLKPNAHPRGQWVERAASKLGRWSTAHPIASVLVVVLIVAASGAFAPHVKKDFFPSSDREQFTISVEMPHGGHLDATDTATRKLEQFLANRSDVMIVSSFVGRSTPKFYYNLPTVSRAPHMSQLAITVTNPASVETVVASVRLFASEKMSEAVVIPRKLEQGPPVPAPVEIRLVGQNIDDLFDASTSVRRALRSIEGTVDVQANYGSGGPEIRYSVDDVKAARAGIGRGAVVQTLFGKTVGYNAGQLREGSDLLPIRVRSKTGEFSTPPQVGAFQIDTHRGSIPVEGIATPSLSFAPSVIHRYNGNRTVSVMSQFLPSTTPVAILATLTSAIEQMDLPAGVRWEVGGSIESSKSADENLGSKAPIAIVLLLAILLAQFNSVRKTLIVVLTAPLAVMGIWPGLYLSSLPFGFVALLGAIALIGIVVNGAIVLIDVIDLERLSGADLDDAIVTAVTRRTRPILLTTLTTIAGLGPLLFSSSTLWPPMASAMISGLTIGTLLTLVVVPSLYKLLFFRERKRVLTVALPMVTTVLFVTMIWVPLASAQTPTNPKPTRSVESILDGTLGDWTAMRVAERVVETAPSLDAARAGVAFHAARVRQVTIDMLPQLMISARYTRIGEVDNEPLFSVAEDPEIPGLVGQLNDPAAQQLWGKLADQNAAIASQSIDVPVNRFSVDANLQVPVSELFTTLGPSRAAAKWRLQSAESKRSASRERIRFRAHNTYYELVRERAIVSLRQERLRDAEERRRVAIAAEQVGSAKRSDVLQTEALVYQRTAELRQSEASERTALERLRTWAKSRDDFHNGEDLTEALGSLPIDSEGLVRTGLKERGELKALEHEERAFGAAVRASKGSRWPVLRVTLGATLANPNERFIPSPSGFKTSWQTSAILSWSSQSLFGGNASVDSSLAQHARMRAELETKRDLLRTQLVGAIESDTAARAMVDASRKGVDAAQEAYRLRQIEFDSGEATLSNVLEAEDHLMAAKIAWVNATVGARIRRAQISWLSATKPSF